MEKLKQYVDGGQVEIAKLDDNNRPQSVPYSELEHQVNRQQRNIDIYKSMVDLSWEQKYQWVNLKRLKAKQKYQNGQFDDAIQIYIDSLLGLDFNDISQNRLHQMKYQLQYPILLNLAICLLKKQQYKKAIHLCDKILSEDPKHLPAICKKIYLLLRAGNLVSSKQLLNQGITIAKQLGQQAHLKDLIQLNGQILKASKQNKQIYARMFSQNTERLQQDEANQSTKLLGKNNQDEDVLYYEEQTICRKIYGFVKGAVYYILPWLRNRNESRPKNLHHSKSN